MGHLSFLANHNFFLNSNIVLRSTPRSYQIQISNMSDHWQLTFLMKCVLVSKIDFGTSQRNENIFETRKGRNLFCILFWFIRIAYGKIFKQYLLVFYCAEQSYAGGNVFCKNAAMCSCYFIDFLISQYGNGKEKQKLGRFQ